MGVWITIRCWWVCKFLLELKTRIPYVPYSSNIPFQGPLFNLLYLAPCLRRLSSAGCHGLGLGFTWAAGQAIRKQEKVVRDTSSQLNPLKMAISTQFLSFLVPASIPFHIPLAHGGNSSAAASPRVAVPYGVRATCPDFVSTSSMKLAAS